MKVLPFVLALLAMPCTSLPLFFQSHFVKIHYKGSDFLAKQLVKGELNLYISDQYEKKKVFGPLYRKRKTVNVKRYFLEFRKQIEKITPYNYKKIMRNYLPNAPDLQRRLGKHGFRYENLPSIVRYYNEFRIPEMDDLPQEPLIELGKSEINKLVAKILKRL